MLIAAWNFILRVHQPDTFLLENQSLGTKGNQLSSHAMFGGKKMTVVLIYFSWEQNPSNKSRWWRKAAVESSVTYHTCPTACLQPLNRSSWRWKIGRAWRLRATGRLWCVLRCMNHQKLRHRLCRVVYGAEKTWQKTCLYMAKRKQFFPALLRDVVKISNIMFLPWGGQWLPEMQQKFHACHPQM